MSDNWLSFATVPYLREDGVLFHLRTKGMYVLCDTEIQYFFGDVDERTRVTWAVSPDLGEVGFCSALQAAFPGVHFSFTFVPPGGKMPLTSGEKPAGLVYNC